MAIKPTDKLNSFRKFAKDQNKISQELKISQGYLSLILSGKKVPSLEIALRISEYTTFPVNDLWEISGPDNGNNNSGDVPEVYI